jgi:crotonobetainyl-CoA:carnitine CoA-transferase CaiB-like acyl-CoA transferase
MADGQDGVLTGVRVLDASQLLPGPWAAQMLGDLGATVTKVEPPGGDAGRHIRGDLFAAANRNKASVTVDLKSNLGRREFLDLVRRCDVVIEGYRPGVMDRLGVGYQDARRVNPRVVYCSISGYGHGVDDRDLPGHDINYLAASGALSFSGHWGETPRRPGVPMADLGAASFAVISILASLHHRDTNGGEGCHLDVSMTDTMSAWAAARGGERLDRHPDDRRHLYPTNDVFPTRDGQLLAVGAVEEKFWTEVRRVLAEHEPRLTDGRFDGLAGRLEHGDEIHDLLRRTFATADLDTWLRRFAKTDAPVSPVMSLPDAADRLPAGAVQELDGQRHVVFPVRRNGAVMGTLRALAPDQTSALPREER